MNANNTKQFITNLNILSWNLNGIWCRNNGFRYNLMNNTNVLDIVQKLKIFSISETHHISGEEGFLYVPDFKCYSVCRPKDKNMKKHKASGGQLDFM